MNKDDTRNNPDHSGDTYPEDTFQADDSADVADDFNTHTGSSVFGARVSQGVPVESQKMETDLYEPVIQEEKPQEEMDLWTDYATQTQWADDPTHPSSFGSEETAGLTTSDVGSDFFAYDDHQKPFDSYAAHSAASDHHKRDMRMAVLFGLILAAAAFSAIRIGTEVALGLVVVILGWVAVELFNALRLSYTQPAVFLGLASVVFMPLAVFWRGAAAIPVVVVLTVIFGALWYLTGVIAEGPLQGLASTLFVVVYVGVLGSHASLILREDNGLNLLLVAILFTVASDVGGLVVGVAAGRNPLSRVSPNKTMEGLIGAFVITLVVGFIVGSTGYPELVDESAVSLWPVLLLALVAAIAAPIGDLAESLLKRDLNLKDMGTLLPGHGGAFDRFDALLFVIPAVYYTALLTDIIAVA
ncbi:MAG: phosphatidate cytidylyltransferase [Acidimicrobiaceae bacterium]|nr:phosphatidate cytidylyltransferase [Acidimicrobiaceae bacterium]